MPLVVEGDYDRHHILILAGGFATLVELQTFFHLTEPFLLQDTFTHLSVEPFAEDVGAQLREAVNSRSQRALVGQVSEGQHSPLARAREIRQKKDLEIRPLLDCLARAMKEEWKIKPYLGVGPLVLSALNKGYEPLMYKSL